MKRRFKFCHFRFSILHCAELKEFRKIIDEFIDIAETIVGEVEQEKMQAIAAQNHLKSISKQRESAQQEIQVKTFARNNILRGVIKIELISESNYGKNIGAGTEENSTETFAAHRIRTAENHRKFLREFISLAGQISVHVFFYLFLN